MQAIDDKNIGNHLFGLIILAGSLLLLPLAGTTQCKSWKLSDRGDTLNCIDLQGMKQGPWQERYPEMRGNPGYEEEGVYLNGKKEGIWRRFSLQGDVMAVETYSWGMLNGKCLYYSLLGLEREESWWAINPSQPYDTIDVPDLYEDGVYKTIIVPNQGRSMRHGTWNWYNTQTGRIEKTEEFIRDSAVSILGSMGVNTRKSTPKAPVDSTQRKTEKPAVVAEWEKKNSGKKKVRVRDGSTGY